MITERAIRGMFYERLQQNTGSSWVDSICTPVINSDQDSEEYNWLGMVPQMSQKLGQKKYSQLREVDWTVNNVEYQGGIVVPKKHILYDKTGQVRTRVNELADRSRSHWIGLIASLIVAGESTACFDGQYFFDTDHVEGDSGSQSNDINADISAYTTSVHGTTTDPSPAEMTHAIMDAVEQILGFKDDKGEYVNEDMKDFLVAVPLSLMKKAFAAFGATYIDGGDNNIIVSQDSFSFEVVASPRLSSWTTKFGVFCKEGNQAPFIRQQRIPNQEAAGYDVGGMLMQTIWTDSEHYKKHDEGLISIETERAAAYGDWKKACLVTLT